MKISAKDEYACSAVLELALSYDPDTPIRVQDIADRQGIPTKFLFQIMQILKRVDIVWSKRGTEGGYVLARAPGGDHCRRRDPQRQRTLRATVLPGIRQLRR